MYRVLNVLWFIYARISKDRAGTNLGVDRQIALCQDLAEREGLPVIGVFVDNDISASTGKPRPGYLALCKALASGPHPGSRGVITPHNDRLHRRPVELEEFIDLCERHKIGIRTVQAGSFDMSDAAGRMVARMLGAAARGEVEHSIERIKAQKQQAAAAGKFRGGPRAFGYESDGVTLRPAEADAIRTATEQVIAGASLRAIARQWNAAGLRTSVGDNEFNSRDVKRILLRGKNAGLMMHEGKEIGEGKWEAIVTAEDYRALKAIVTDPSRLTHASFERVHQGSGVYLCGVCGARVHIGGGSKLGSNYQCSTGGHFSRNAKKLDEYVSAVVVEYLSAPDARIRLGGDGAARLAELHTKREGIRARLDELGDLFGSGAMDGSQFRRANAAIRAEYDAVDAQLAATRAADTLANLVLAGDDLEAEWAALSADVRGKLIDALMTVTINRARKGKQPGGNYFNPDFIDIQPKR